MRAKIIISLLIAFTVFSLFPVHSSYAETLTLQEAIEIALKENPSLKAYSWRLKGVKEERAIAASHRLPSLRLEHRISKTDNPTYAFMAKLNQERFTQQDFAIDSLNSPAPIGDFQTSIRVSLPLYAPRISIGIELAEGKGRAEEALFREREEQTALEVLKAYLSIRTARAYLEAAEKGLLDATEHRKIAESRYRNGLGLYSDLLRTEVAVKKMEMEVERARSGLDIAKYGLGLLLGRTDPVDVKDESAGLNLNPVEFFMNASMKKEEIKYMKTQVGNAERFLRLQKAALLPEIGIGGSYQINDHRSPLRAEGESYMVGAFLRWNILDPTIPAKIRKAEAGVNEASAALEGLKKAVRFRVIKAYRQIEEKKKNLQRAEASVKEAEEALRLVRLRYKNSLAPVVDLLDTEALLQKARAERIKAENDLQMALAELYYQSGILRESILDERTDGIKTRYFQFDRDSKGVSSYHALMIWGKNRDMETKEEIQ
jgi:outer membrane protein TolC